MSRKPKILVIDDDVILLGSLLRILERSGYEAVGVTDGRRGLDLLAADSFALVITDLIMPGAEGIETIQAVRDLDPRIPIMAISGSFEHDGYSALDDARLLGADCTLAKPFGVDQLTAAVRSLLPPRRPDSTGTAEGSP